MALCFVLSAFFCADATSAGGELPPLIPREVLFGNPDKSNPKISPDGKRLAYIAPDEGVLNLWVRTVGLADDHAVTKDRKQGIRAYAWAHNNEHLIYIQDKDGDENWRLYAVELKTNSVRDLTPFEGVQARVFALDQKFPDETLVGINKRDPKLHDVYRINIRTAEAALEVENREGFASWIADNELKVRAAAKSTAGGGFEVAVRDTTNAPWRTLLTWKPEDVINSDPRGFTPDGKSLYVTSSTGSNTGELREIELATGTERTLASDRQADVAGLFINRVDHAVQAVSFYKERTHWRVLDPSIEDDFRALERVRRGDFRVLNRDNADRTWLVEYNTDDGPISYYAYDRESKKAALLFTNRKALEGLTLAKMAPISFKARDGLTIPGYLTAPPGVPARDLPMVVLVHGGPWYRDLWGYNGVAQWLANRGYAVLHVNFRGSTGYGKDFINAGSREWGGKMQDDLVDGVNWAVGRGIADPKRVAVFGSSYGGYAALAGVTFTPDVFCCAVSISGAGNLVSYIKSLPPYMKPLEPLFWDRVGHPDKDAEFLKSRSPLFAVDRITKPLLIVQGANDPWVKKTESLQIVEALKRGGKPVEYVEYPDEGHDLIRPENRLDFYAKAEKFLAQHLRGRYQE